MIYYSSHLWLNSPLNWVINGNFPPQQQIASNMFDSQHSRTVVLLEALCVGYTYTVPSCNMYEPRPFILPLASGTILLSVLERRISDTSLISKLIPVAVLLFISIYISSSLTSPLTDCRKPTFESDQWPGDVFPCPDRTPTHRHSIHFANRWALSKNPIFINISLSVFRDDPVLSFQDPFFSDSSEGNIRTIETISKSEPNI